MPRLSRIEQLYLEEDALGLARRVRGGELTPAELLEVAIARLERLDGTLGAVPLRWFERARQRAGALPDGPLRGVPFLLKDYGAAVAGEALTHGARLFAEHRPTVTSELAQRYEGAGLQILGRSATPEMAITTTTESALYGPTRNPWNNGHTAGGSSGGAAAAVAAGIVPAAHASDGGGSIRVPASCCGLFGLKPTRARVSLAPSRGESWAGLSINHAITRSVRDSALLLDIASGQVAGDPYCAPPPTGPYLDEVGRDPGVLRIAVSTRAFNGVEVDPVCELATSDAATLCAGLGHQVEEAHPAVDGEALATATRAIVAVNLQASLATRARQLGATLTEDLVEPLTWATARAAERVTGLDYLLAVETLHAAGRSLAAFFARFDILLTPTMACPPLRIGDLALDHPDSKIWGHNLRRTIGFTQLMNAAGTPAMSVPLYWSDQGLPIGTQFAAPFGQEAVLFRLAGALEQARPWRQRRPTQVV